MARDIAMFGFNEEITATFTCGNDVLQMTQLDNDSWQLVSWEDKNGERINRNFMILRGKHIRLMIKNKALFIK